MTDRDIVDRVGRYFRNDVTTRTRSKRERDKKDVYTTRAYGRRAIELLMTIYTFLGHRRRERAEEVIARWKASPRLSYRPRLKPVKGIQPFRLRLNRIKGKAKR